MRQILRIGCKLTQKTNTKPIKRDLPSNFKNIIRFNRFDTNIINKDQTNIEIIEKIQEKIFHNKGFVFKNFNIIEDKSVEIRIPENLDFFKKREIINYKEYFYV